MTVQIRKLSTAEPDFVNQLSSILAFEAKEDESINTVVANVLNDVKENGDKAVLEYTKRFDRLALGSGAELEISREECKAALASLSPERRNALEVAAERVRIYHEHQKQSCGGEGYSFTDEDGTSLGQKVTPLDSVGIYVPGGKAAYPSSVLMNAIPAQVAGVKEIVMVVPTPDGAKNELVLAAAALSGVTMFSRSVALRLSAHWLMEPKPFHPSTRSSGPVTLTLPLPNAVFSVRSAST